MFFAMQIESCGTCARFWKPNIKKLHISELFHEKKNRPKHITMYHYNKDCGESQIKLKLNNRSLVMLEQCRSTKILHIQKIKLSRG